MKKLLLATLILTFSIQFSTIASWQIVNGRKTLNLSGSAASQMSANALGKQFYLFKGDSLIFYNMNGEIESVKIINDTIATPNVKLLKNQISTDGKTYGYVAQLVRAPHS